MIESPAHTKISTKSPKTGVSHDFGALARLEPINPSDKKKSEATMPVLQMTLKASADRNIDIKRWAATSCAAAWAARSSPVGKRISYGFHRRKVKNSAVTSGPILGGIMRNQPYGCLLP